MNNFKPPDVNTLESLILLLDTVYAVLSTV